MKKIGKNINIILSVLIIFFSVLNFFVYKIDYIYRPKNYVIFLILYFLLVTGVTVVSVKFKPYTHKKGKIFGCIMPVFVLIYMFSLEFSFDFKIDYKLNNSLFYNIMFAISVTSSLIIFFVYNSIRWIKVCAIIFTGTLTAFFGFIMFFSILFSDFGDNVVIQNVNSPMNTYSAVVVSSDQGALGGATHIYVYNINKEIKLLSGIIKPREIEIWTGKWNEKPVLEWKNDNEILIDGKGYIVN